mgnify:CR=1 FL=1
MTRIAVVADCHIGNHRQYGAEVVAGINYRCRLALEALRNALLIADDHKCEHVVVCGDLFDSSKVEPQVVFALMTLFSESNARVHVLCGNHDINSNAPADNALSALAFVPNVTVYEGSPRVVDLGVKCLFVPYKNEQGRDYIARAVRGSPDVAAVFFHAGVSDTNTPAFLKNTQDSIDVDDIEALLGETSARLFFAGNWHTTRSWRVKDARVYQCGTLVPTGYDDQAAAFVHVYDGRTVTKHNAPGPRFWSFDKLDAKAIADAALKSTCAFVRCTLPLAEVQSAKDLVEGLLLSTGASVIEVVPSKREVSEQREAALVDAARVAREDEVRNAVAAYVHNMPLTASVDRAALLSLVMDALDGKT